MCPTEDGFFFVAFLAFSWMALDSDLGLVCPFILDTPKKHC